MKLSPVRLLAIAIVTSLGLIASPSMIYSAAGASLPGGQQSKDKPQLQKSSQPERRDSDDAGAIKIGTSLVHLDVTVVDQNNLPVMDLKKEHFQIFEDKIPQKIEFFSRDLVPVSVVFTIDTSGSMRPKLDTVIKASTNLAKDARKGDEMAVIEFKDQPELLEEFTTDQNEIIDALQGLVASRQTAMLDALYLGADYAHKDARNKRRALIVVTDGLDKNSYYKFEEVVSHLRETDVQVYLIGFTEDLNKDNTWVFGKSEKGKAEALLNRLATETGGKAFFPKELSEVHTIAQQISLDLRTQYSIDYYPTNTSKDGTFRAVKVQLEVGSRRLAAHTRPGYTATREGEPSRGSTKPE